jgi:hypothetical protein
MISRLYPSPVLIELQEDFLGHFLRCCSVVKIVKGDAVDQSLMLSNSVLEVGARHLPSQLITIEPAISTQNPFWVKLEVQMKHLFCLIVILGVLTSCSSTPKTADRSPSSADPADPLTGEWTGEWGPSPNRQTAVTVELKWDGTTLSGTVNPRRDPIELSKATYDPQSQTVTMELDGPNASREIVHYVVKGKIEGTTMSGTFDRAGETGTFNLEKQ